MDKFENAKKIYFNNFASTYFMDRNGELKAYKKAKVPIELENVWKEEITKNILADIKSGKDVYLIWNISCMDISDEQMLKMYADLSRSENKKTILDALISLKKLFCSEKRDLWEQVLTLFKS